MFVNSDYAYEFLILELKNNYLRTYKVYFIRKKLIKLLD